MNNRVTSKPPLPQSNNQQQTYNSNGYLASPNSVNNNLTPNEGYNRTNSFNSRLERNVNMYDPFPSLASLKTKPEFYTNIGTKFRKTKLW